MPRYIISRGEYVVHNIIIEADDEDVAVRHGNLLISNKNPQ
ncbi:hypothetical protein [Roseovarius sp. D22-M7]